MKKNLILITILLIGAFLLATRFFGIATTEVTFKNEVFLVKSTQYPSTCVTSLGATGQQGDRADQTYLDLRGGQFDIQSPRIAGGAALGTTEARMASIDMRKVDKVTLIGTASAESGSKWSFRLTDLYDDVILYEGTSQVYYQDQPIIITRISDTQYQVSGKTSKTVTISDGTKPIFLKLDATSETCTGGNLPGGSDIALHDLIIEKPATQAFSDIIPSTDAIKIITQNASEGSTSAIIYIAIAIGVILTGGYFLFRKKR